MAERKRFTLAPPAAFLEENGCQKGSIQARGMVGSYCVTKGHKMRTSAGGERACEDVLVVDASSGTQPQIFAIFDGHAGVGCAAAVSRWLPLLARGPERGSLFPRGTGCKSLQSVFSAVDDLWTAQQAACTCPDRSGSTGTVLMRDWNTLHIANVGDSAAILSCKDGTYKVLTADHRASVPAEVQRICDLGGSVSVPSSHDDVPRVNGTIQVTRSFGNVELKQYIKAQAHTLTHRVTDRDDFIVLASDGLWDVVSHSQAVKIVRQNRTDKKQLTAAEELARRAYRDRSMDDISVAVIQLSPRKSRWPRIVMKGAVMAVAMVVSSLTAHMENSHHHDVTPASPNADWNFF